MKKKKSGGPIFRRFFSWVRRLFFKQKTLPKLFPDLDRTRKEAMRRGESLFEFYTSCARLGYDEFRNLSNDWLAELPDAEQEQLIARMSRGGDIAFQSGFLELLVHALLKRLDYDVVVHPVVTGTSKHPDFGIVDRDGGIVCYVEVTSVNLPSQKGGEANREAALYNAIDKISLPPGCVFGYDVKRHGKSSPALKPLTTEIISWVNQVVESKKEKATRTFTAADWEIELDLHVTKSKTKFERSIGIAMGGVGWIAPHLDLRDALDIKARRYGSLGVPYLIAVADAKGQLFGSQDINDALSEALFGDEVVQWREGDDEAKLARKGNGFWRNHSGPRNMHVSGVMVFPDPGMWGLRSHALQPTLAINPWADHALPTNIQTLRRFEVENEQWTLKNGRIVADILELPNPWPPVDAEN